MRDVFIDLLVGICDRWSMSAKQDRQIAERAHARERCKVIAHVSFWRIDQHGPIADDVIAGNQRASAVIMEAKVAERMSGCGQRPQRDARRAVALNQLYILENR